MSKKKDLKLVFEFIADFLKEEDDKSDDKILTPKEVEKDSETDDKKSINRALAIMKRIDDIDKAKTNAYKMIKNDENVKSSLQKQLNELRHEHAIMVSEDTIAEEKELGVSTEFKIGSLEENKKKLEKAKKQHNEIKSEVKDKLGIDLDTFVVPDNNISKPRVRPSRGKNN